MNWYKHYIGDYQRDTGHLSMLEHGAYRLMLDTHYATEKPLPKTQSVLFRLLRALDSVEQDAVLSVLEQYWIETPEGYVNERSLDEFHKTSNKIKAARENGNRGGRPKKTHGITETETQTETETKPTAKAPQTPDTRHQTLTDISTNFDDWWSAYPKRVGKGQALKAYRSACKKTDPETLLTHAKRYAAERDGEDKRFTKHPATWLNGQCWLDEPEEPHATGRSNRNPDEAERRRIIAETLDLAGSEESGGDDGILAHGAGVVIQHTPGGEGTSEGGDSSLGGYASTGEPEGHGGLSRRAAGVCGGVGEAAGRESDGENMGGSVGRSASRPVDGGDQENDSQPLVQHAAPAEGNPGTRCRETGAAEAGAAHCPDGIVFNGAEMGAGGASRPSPVSVGTEPIACAVGHLKTNFG